MPKLAAFPKAYLDALCVEGSMTIRQWIDLAGTLDIDGLEFYAEFLELKDESACQEAKRIANDAGLPIPMLCCSPDFTHPDAIFRREQIGREKRFIDFAEALGAKYCRILTGQRRPEVSRADGIRYSLDCINECLEHASHRNITLVLENHYKDNYWKYAEFAQKMDVFCELVDQINEPNFGVNFDPSNALLAGEDPLELLKRVRHRVATMHSSDRYLAEGSLEDLRREENETGYARRLRHGEIGKGLNDYDALFSLLADAGFDGWISIEDGVDGMNQLHASARFLRAKIKQHWPGKDGST
jgi:sugar phosphate isomerase/epimerase